MNSDKDQHDVVYAKVHDRLLPIVREEIKGWDHRVNLSIKALSIAASILAFVLSVLVYFGYDNIRSTALENVQKEIDESAAQMNTRIEIYADEAMTYTMLARWDAYGMEKINRLLEHESTMDLSSLTRTIERSFQSGSVKDASVQLRKLSLISGSIRNASDMLNPGERLIMGKQLAQMLRASPNNLSSDTYIESASYIIAMIDALGYYNDNDFNDTACVFAVSASSGEYPVYVRYAAFLSNVSTYKTMECLDGVRQRIGASHSYNYTATLLALAQSSNTVGINYDPMASYLNNAISSEIRTADEWARVLAISVAYAGNDRRLKSVHFTGVKRMSVSMELLGNILAKFSESGYRVLLAHNNCYIVGEDIKDNSLCLDNIGYSKGRTIRIHDLAAEMIGYELMRNGDIAPHVRSFAQANLAFQNQYNDTLFEINGIGSVEVQYIADEGACVLNPVAYQVNSASMLGEKLYIYWNGGLKALWYDQMRNINTADIVAIDYMGAPRITPVLFANIGELNRSKL